MENYVLQSNSIDDYGDDNITVFGVTLSKEVADEWVKIKREEPSQFWKPVYEYQIYKPIDFSDLQKV